MGFSQSYVLDHGFGGLILIKLIFFIVFSYFFLIFPFNIVLF